MKHPFRSHILPFFTVGAGGLGFALRLWLFSAYDEKGLLPAKHPAGTLLFLLSAVVLGILFLATRKLESRSIDKKALCPINTVACLLAGIGLMVSTVSSLDSTFEKLELVALVLNLAGALTMFLMAFFEFRGKKLVYWQPAVLTIVLMVNAIALCRVWGKEPQVQVYFFPMLASVFLMLTAYQKTALLLNKAKRSLLAFFSQSAAFFCCLSFVGQYKIFYCGLFLWAVRQIFSCIPRKKES